MKGIRSGLLQTFTNSFSDLHGSRDLRGHVSVLLDPVLLVPLREAYHEPVGDGPLDLHRFHPLQEEALFIRLS